MASPLLDERGPDSVRRPLAGAILVAGLGSIGQRHLRNLEAIGHEPLALYRTGRATLVLDDRGLPTYDRLEAALAARPLAIVVANPSALHLETALAAARAGAHLFIEKPLSHSLEGVGELRVEAARRGLVVQLGFQFRFHPTLLRVREWLAAGAIGVPVSAHVHWGESLREWHRWEDYRGSYAARAELGGGVLRTLCHPFDYLRLLFGEPEWVAAETGRLGDLEIDVEDTALVTLRFASGLLANVYLDCVGRPRRHRLEIVGRDGRIVWNGEDGVGHLHEGSGRVRSMSPAPGFERNSPYRDEMLDFLACLRGEATPRCSLEDGVRALEISLAAAEAARSGRRVHV